MAQEDRYNAYTLINHLYYPEKIEQDDDPAGTNSQTAEEKVLIKYVTGDRDRLSKAVNVPDIITNINGNHGYKLISSKDIDFENIFLENSVIDENGWNGFPEERRWANGASVRINEMYELMNVIDYLLCSTQYLTSEINKLKYDESSDNLLWFVSNAISQAPQYYLQDRLTAKNFVNGNEYGLKKTFLNPSQYTTHVNAKSENNTYSFGIASSFHDDNNTHLISRIVKNKYSNKKVYGLEANIVEQKTPEYSSQTVWQSSVVYGYLIGEDLHLYPGFNLFNFLINDIDYCTNMKNFVDVENKCLLNKTYFKYNKTTFKKVYIEFLSNKTTQTSLAGSNYLLYVNGNSGKKEIIYCTDTTLLNVIKTYYTYIVFDYESGLTGIKNQYLYNSDTHTYIPYLYKIKNSNTIEFTVITPAIDDIDTANATIEIEYFKNDNNITVVVKNGDSNKEISLSDEKLQEDVLIYNNKRFNVPEKIDIIFETNSTILNKSNTNYKIDDEYLDYPYYWNNNENDSLDNITDYNYYRYNSNATIAEIGNTNKRVFTKFESLNEFKNFLQANKYNDDEISFTQVYKKIENAYDIEYDTTVSELLTQQCPYERLTNIIKDIKENHITKDENNNLTLSYILPEDLEQIKFDLDLLIEETGKTKEGFKKIPLNINRIHNISINFNNPQLYIEEANKYENNKYGVLKTSAVNNTTILAKLSAEEWKNSDENPNPGNYLTATDLYKNYSGELDKLNNGMNILSFMNSEFETGTFNDSDISNNTCYLDIRSYDNTINNGRTLYITYNAENYYLNLIGGKKLNTNLTTKRGNVTIKNFAMAYVVNNNEKIYLNTQANSTDANIDNLAQIFSIHGLGFNYYCHGADSYAWRYQSGSPLRYSFYNAAESHNLLTVCDMNETSNINKFLGISVKQQDVVNNNVIKDYVSYLYVSNGDYGKTQNLLENKEYYLNNGKVIYNGELLTSYDNIITDSISIHKRKYTCNMLKEGELPQNNNITYYIQTTYLMVWNSTFYPSPDSYPPLHYDNNNNFIGAYYDFNNATEVEKYVKYRNAFGSDKYGEENSYYRPLTLSLQYQENINDGIPFFNESNVAKLKLNVVRDVNEITAPVFEGIGITSYISPELKYYLSDFTVMKITREGSLGDRKSYTGSFMSFNSDIYEQNNIVTFDEVLFDKNHVYKTVNGESVIDLKNNFTLNNVTVPYPIPAKYDDDDNLYYFYDIIRIAELNKIKIDNYSLYANNESVSGNNLDTDPCKIDYELFLIDFTNYIFNKINNNLAKTAEIHIDPIAHYGSRNYQSNSILSGSTGARILFNYIHRIHDNSVLQTSLYQSLDYNNNGTIIKYDLFKYSFDFDNIVIKVVENNTDKYYMLNDVFESDKLKYNDDAFRNNTKDDNIYRYFRTQVEAFANYNIFTMDEIIAAGLTIEGTESEETDGGGNRDSMR